MQILERPRVSRLTSITSRDVKKNLQRENQSETVQAKVINKNDVRSVSVKQRAPRGKKIAKGFLQIAQKLQMSIRRY